MTKKKVADLQEEVLNTIKEKGGLLGYEVKREGHQLFLTYNAGDGYTVLKHVDKVNGEKVLVDFVVTRRETTENTLEIVG